jgi:hypothetical protein
MDQQLEEAVLCIPIMYQISPEEHTERVTRRPANVVDAYRILKSGNQSLPLKADETTMVELYLLEVARGAPERNIFLCDRPYLGIGPNICRKEICCP